MRLSSLVRCSLSVALLAAPAFSSDLVRTNGVLGGTLDYQLSANPLKIYILAPSLNAGPTPLFLVDPRDTRVLSVGLDIPGLWSFGVLDAAGNDSVSYPLPNDATLNGVVVHAQFVTAPGATLIVQEVSNATTITLGQTGSSHFAAGLTPEQVTAHSATLLADGRVALIGGTTGGSTFTVASRKIIIFDPQTQAFTQAPGLLTESRTLQTSTLLNDGRVLVVGGSDMTPVIRSSVDIFDPTTGLVTPTAPLNVPRTAHTATKLNDGRVLVVGGTSSLDLNDPLGSLGAVHQTSRIYNPTSNSWSAGPSLPNPRALHSASLLGNGKVLVTGGLEITTILFVQIPSITDTCHLYDPVSNSFQGVPSMSRGKAFHSQITLSDGTALVAGGIDGDLITQNFFTIADCQVYNPAANNWTTKASLTQARAYGELNEAGGKVVMIGGLTTFDIATFDGTPATRIETTTTQVLGWGTSANTVLPRFLGHSTAIEGGQRILTSGYGDNGTNGTIPELSGEIYIP